MTGVLLEAWIAFVNDTTREPVVRGLMVVPLDQLGDLGIEAATCSSSKL